MLYPNTSSEKALKVWPAASYLPLWFISSACTVLGLSHPVLRFSSTSSLRHTFHLNIIEKLFLIKTAKMPCKSSETSDKNIHKKLRTHPWNMFYFSAVNMFIQLFPLLVYSRFLQTFISSNVKNNQTNF